MARVTLATLVAILGPAFAAADAAPPTLRLPAGPRPTRYDLELTVDPTRSTFQGEVQLHLVLSEPTSLLWLNATELTVTRASAIVSGENVAARPVAGGDSFVGVAFERPIGPGAAAVAITYSGPIDETRSRGLYRVKEADGEWYAYTFFEPIDARRVMPCFDEPDAKVPWRLRLRVRSGDVALANAQVESEHPLPSGLKLVSFAESKPMPSYLVAFVVGPFEVVESGTAGTHATPLRFVLPRGRSGELRYAREVSSRVVELLEGYFGMPYPFGKLDVAVVPRFWGTMEHPGLLAMGQPLTLIRPGPESVGRRSQYANILTHELAHYWFGDYVTCAWWEDVWLNEALAEWLDGKLTDRLEPSWRHAVWVRRNTSYAMKKDALASAKRIRQPVESNSDIESAFDGDTTYFKGAAVLATFERWLGEDTFRAAIRRYLSAHAWGNATASDFMAAFDAETGRDISGPFRTFVDQPGLPLVSAALDCRAAPRLRLRQERFLALAGATPATESWGIPVCVRWGGAGAGRACTLLESREQEMAIGSGSCPDWVMVNDGGTGYYRVAYGEALLRGGLKEGAKGAGSGLHPIERIALLDDLVALVGAGRLPVSAALDELPAFLGDPDATVAFAALDALGLLHPDRLPEELRPNYARAVRQLLGARAKALGWEPGQDPPDLQALRRRVLPTAALYGEDLELRSEARRRTLAWLADRSSADSDLSWSLLAVARFDGDRSLFDRLLAEARRSTDREELPKLLWALGGFRDPQLADEALGLLLRDEFDLRDSAGILRASIGQRETREQAWRFVTGNFDRLTSRMRGDEASWMITAVTTSFCDADKRRDVAAFFEPRVARIDGAALALRNALESVDVCIAEQARNAAGVAAFLSRY